MLEHLIKAALGRRPELVRALVEEELTRLQRGGYLDSEQLEELRTRALEALGAGLEEAREKVAPFAGGAARAVRDLLDVPSREEVEQMLERRSDSSVDGE